MFLIPLALAADPLWWTESGIALKSELFGKAQARDAEAYEKAQGELERAKRMVSDLELSVAALGAPGDARDYLEGIDRALSGQFLRLQKHTDLLGDDYSKNFGAAVERALPVVAKGLTVTECKQTNAALAMLGREPKCAGRDISADVARALDADAALQAAIRSILEVDWPSIALPSAPQPPTPWTGSSRSVDVATVVRALAGESIRAADDERDVALEAISDELDSSVASTKQAGIDAALAAEATWAKAVYAAATPALARLKKSVEKAAKKGGPAEVALCHNPEALGGCGLPDVTAEVLALAKGP